MFELTIQSASKKYLESRNSLLQDALRDHSFDFNIDSEYPLTLSPSSLKHSYIGLHEGKVITHGNLFPRVLLSAGQEIGNIALIGNIATNESYRGRGLMRSTLEFLENQAESNGIKALILWSDLNSFYEKLGFKKIGSENRFFIDREKVKNSNTQTSLDIYVENPKNIDQNLTSELLNIREEVGTTVQRSPFEFAELLKIPNTYLIAASSSIGIEGYAIIGKGADFGGVIHEWGFKNFKTCLGIINKIFDLTDFAELIMITPKDSRLDQQLKEISNSCESHSMGLCKVLDKSITEYCENLFIWGLDSI